MFRFSNGFQGDVPKSLAVMVAFLTLGTGCDDASPAALSDPDARDVACSAARFPLQAIASTNCGDASEVFLAATGSAHIADDVPITYPVDPPSSGDHRGQWARWGAYSFLAPQRWLHNLEHGGVAVLYDPCLDDASVATLRTWLAARPDDATGAFRWILTPYPGLQQPLAFVAWENTLLLDCWTTDDISAAEAFLGAHYRQAPEDVPFDGSFRDGWLGR